MSLKVHSVSSTGKRTGSRDGQPLASSSRRWSGGQETTTFDVRVYPSEIDVAAPVKRTLADGSEG